MRHDVYARFKMCIANLVLPSASFGFYKWRGAFGFLLVRSQIYKWRVTFGFLKWRGAFGFQIYKCTCVRRSTGGGVPSAS